VIRKICKTCGVEFDAIKEGQYFCKRKCFKRDYYKRNKARLALLAKARPIYRCGNCGHAAEVPFDPIKYPKRFTKFKCPECSMARSEAIGL
jgi:DNA-directed RNA polymerase subunit RPC12/RpoP